MDLENVVNYVLNTPGNSNPNVLRPMLQALEGSGGGDVEGTSIKSTDVEQGKVLTADGEGGASWQTAGSSLPEVTAADNGKILIVQSGEWALDFPPSDALDTLMQEEF